MATTQLNAAQLNVISLMSSIDTEQEQQKLQNILLEFYRNKLDSLLLQFQQDNNITQTITSDRVFSVEALTGADVEPVALNMHFGLREISLPLTSVEAKIEWAKELRRGDKRESEENN